MDNNISIINDAQIQYLAARGYQLIREQKPAEAENTKVRLLLLFFVMWVHGYKKVLPSSYKGVGPAHLSWDKSETYGNEVSRVGDGVN